MSMILDGSNGVQFNDSSLQGSAASPYVLKNRIINGAMQIWQRGTTFTFGSGANTYTTDRWWGVCNTASGETISQSTNVPSNFQYSLKMQRPNGNTGTQALNILQIIETTNCYDLAGQSVTLSFWAKTGANYSGGALSVYLQTGTVADEGNSNYFSWTGRATPLTTTQSITSTWTRYSFTTTIASNALEVGVQLQFTPTGTAGADDSLYITGVQLEQNTSATPFERRLYNQELANCQRYLPCINAPSVSASAFCNGYTYSSSAGQVFYTFQVAPRTPPTGIVATAASGFLVEVPGLSTSAPTSITFSSSTLQGSALLIASTAAFGVGGAVLKTNSSSAQIQFTGCEL